MSRRVVGRQTTMRLRLDGRTLAPARGPHSSNGDLVLVEGVVEVAGQLSEVETAQAWDTSGGVRGPGTRKERQDPEAFLDFGSEDLVMESVLQLPDLLTRDVPLRGRSEPNAARLQDDLSCFRIAAASTRRPAATSASESRKAACRAARSAFARIEREELDLGSVREIRRFIHNKAPSADASLQSHECCASTREVAQQALGAATT